jgi:hypothetical protein
MTTMLAFSHWRQRQRRWASRGQRCSELELWRWQVIATSECDFARLRSSSEMLIARRAQRQLTAKGVCLPQ